MARFTAGSRSMTKGELLEARYKSARGNLLVAIILTVLNSVLLVLGGNIYFPFSSIFPYAMIGDGWFWTGLMYTPEEYAEMGVPESEMMSMGFLYFMLVVALASLGAYLLCWIFSKKRVGWLITAAVFFVLDTLFLIYWYGVAVDFLLDYLFHGWLLFILIRGILSHFRLKEMERENAARTPEFVPVTEQGTVIDGETGAVSEQDEPIEEAELAAEGTAEEFAEQSAEQDTQPNSPVLHRADYSVKSRVLLEYKEREYDICYRRVGKVNELVINSMVYDTINTGLVEQPHELCAYLDGHEIIVGYGADSHMYIRFDGEIIKRKIRWI